MQPTDRHQLQQRWRQAQRASRRRLLVHGVAAWTALLGLVALSVVLTLGLTAPPRWVALGLVVAGSVMLLTALWSLLVAPWRRLHGRTRLARTLDRAGGFHDTLAAADEVLRQPARWSGDDPVRAALRERLLARGLRLLGDLDLARLLPVGRPWLVFGALTLVLLVAGGVDRWAPWVLGRGLTQMELAWSPAAAARGGLPLVADAMHVIAGESATVAVRDLVAAEIEPPVCEVRQGAGAWRQVPARHRQPDARWPFQLWEAELRDVREDLVFRFRRGGRTSDEGRLEVWRPPLLIELAAELVPPAYTRLPPRALDRLPAYLEAPQGSRLRLHGRASNTLVAATLDEDLSGEPSRSDTTSASIAGATPLTVAGAELHGELLLQQPRRFRIRLEDTRGLTGAGDLVHEIGVIPDRAPLVRLQRPDDDGQLPMAAALHLLAGAEDDFGLAEVTLLLRRGADDGGAWAALPGGVADDEGWQRIDLLDADGQPRLGHHTATLELGELPVQIRADEAPDPAVVSLQLDLSAGELALVPGDILELALEAVDTRRPLPAGRTRSAILRLQVPSSLDLLEARDESAGEQQAELAEMRRQASDLGAELERLRRELLKNPSLDWDRRQELEAALERQQQLQAETERLAEALGRDLEELAENQLTSPELMEKMDRIEELLADHQDRSLENLLETLRQSLDQMSPKELNRAMEDLAREQNELRRRLDTAMSMLDDLAREQEMEGLARMVAEMLEEQQELADASRRQGENREGERSEGEQGGEQGDEQEGAQDGDQEGDQDGDQGESGDQDQSADQASNEDLARRQESLADELSELEKKLAETLDELAQDQRAGDQTAAEKEMMEALAEALEQMKEQQTQQTMDQAGESLQQENSDQASQQMQQALTDLAGLYHVMLRTQMAMQMAMQAEQAGQMRDVAADLLVLSQRQEEVGQAVPGSLRDIRADDLARRQFDVVQGTVAVRDALGDVAGAAPQEILRMLQRLDQLIETQGSVLEQLKERRARAARTAASSSLSGMNEVVINLLTQAQQQSQGQGSGQPQQSMSQQLQQMSQQQSGLNALAEQLRRKEGRISQELRAGMQRLQQGQQGLAGQARRLAEEQRQRELQGDTGRLLGDLDRLAEDMERVGDDLAGGLVTEETMRRQERILSRLLDMHNASRERDWARRRESRASDELFADQVGELGPDPADRDSEARRWRAVEEAPPAYRDLVRRYFREIQRLHQETGRLDDGRSVPRGQEGL